MGYRDDVRHDANHGWQSGQQGWDHQQQGWEGRQRGWEEQRGWDDQQGWDAHQGYDQGHDQGYGQQGWDRRPQRGWDDERPRRPRPSGGGGRRPPARGKGSAKRKGKGRGGKGSSKKMIIWAIVLVVVAGIGWKAYDYTNSQDFREMMAADYGESDMGDKVYFSVPQGAGGSQIAISLLEQEIIKSRTAFVGICDHDTRCTKIQPGAYELQKHSPAKTVIDILAEPKNKIVKKFTVPEGLSTIQTIKSLSKQTGIAEQDFLTAIKDPKALGVPAEWYQRSDGKPAANTDPKAQPIEGFLFPETYFYDPTASAPDVLKLMVSQFLKVAEEIKLKERAAALKLSPYELLIAASLAQDEAGKKEDFAKVARVVYNNAYKGYTGCYCLRFDSAENYWLELNGKPTKNSGDMTESELNDPANPYNTHADGSKMPIGPISNPGQDALLGAAQPATGEWKYFVAVDQNGTTEFSTTWTGFCNSKAKANNNGLHLDMSDCW